ncbi:MAG: aminopeptidase P family protein [Muribaculum sp.]
MTTDIKNRLRTLREAMAASGIALTVIPHSDPHQSEYMSPHWHLREYYSGFNGSAGDLVVTGDEALLWTDSRYFLQAEQQLEGTGVRLMKAGLPDTPSIAGYITGKLKPGDTVGIDGLIYSADEAERLEMTLAGHAIKLAADFTAAADNRTARPALPDNPVFIYEERYAGEGTRLKIDKILDAAAVHGAGSVFVTALDEIAWALNLRGSDVEYNPVFTSFLYLSANGSTLFVNDIKLDGQVKKYLDMLGISQAPYSGAAPFLSSLPRDAKVLVDPAKASRAFIDALGDKAVKAPSPVPALKALRNEVQIQGLHDAMLRDGVALVKGFAELEERLAAGEPITEMEVGRILSRRRAEQPLYFDDSFGTIAGFKEHGAIVHYEADETSDAAITGNGLLLVDSGAQYLDGTTDITRTVSIGDPSQEERHDFTLVLKGHIALAMAVFPEGTRGAQLDALARIPMWAEGKGYLHGTGHGVGHFLNVHEGPQSIRLNENPVTLKPGMLTSNEPGIYLTGKYGIRCENLMLTVPAFTSDFSRFLRFETVTLFPFDLRLVDTSMLTDEELRWLNEYHRRVHDTLSPRLDEKERAWLDRNTRPLTRNEYYD